MRYHHSWIGWSQINFNDNHNSVSLNLHNNPSNDGDLDPVLRSIAHADKSTNGRDNRDEDEDTNKNIVDLIPDLLEEGLLFALRHLVFSILFETFGDLGGRETFLTDVRGEVELLDDFLLGHDVPWWHREGLRLVGFR